MFDIRHVCEGDRAYWIAIDEHMRESELESKIRDRRGYILRVDGEPVGLMRYNLFWDSIPFLTLITIDEEYQGKGFGRQAMLCWEEEMRSLGYKMVMTSTQVDEEAQHFYRKLGYKDKGGIFLDNTPFEQPQELIMLKTL